MKVDRRLNLVIPIEREEGKVYVFAAPIGREVFEQYFLIISKAFTAIYAENLSYMGGPRVAGMMLKKIAKESVRADADGKPSNWWEGPDGVEAGLFREMRRLANVIVPDPVAGGWTTITYEDALQRGLIGEEEASEVEGSLAFFTVNWSMHRRAVIKELMEAAAGMWGQQITSSALSEYRNSLTTSTAPGSTGGTVTPSSIPS